ncbi:MAG: anti-sigma factor antagonist [Lachnospiraceae bacterium]|nr:anti-sigma factor antagonist [Lachnospiraceae bacterium]
MNEEQFKVIEDYLCVKMPKEVDHHNAGGLSEKVDEFIYGQKINNIVFDFSGTEFMDSSGIGILAGRYKKLQCFEGKVYVINANRQIKRILLLSGIQKYVVIMKDE